MRFYLHHSCGMACEMHGAFRMELNMGIDSRHGRLFLIGLRLGFTGGGRLRYWPLAPKKQVAPGSQSS
jgi:hypothetical protein